MGNDMARRDRKEVISRLRVLLIHVLKWIHQKEMRTPSWQTTVLNQQAELEYDLESGVLRNHAEQSLDPALEGGTAPEHFINMEMAPPAVLLIAAPTMGRAAMPLSAAMTSLVPLAASPAVLPARVRPLPRTPGTWWASSSPAWAS